jgi:sulfide dehydrogenase cytochrome subunit
MAPALALAHGDHGDERAARALASGCAACHGTNGKAQDPMPVLAGKSRQYIVERLQSFKSGLRQATIMHQHAKGYSDDQIAMLADYFSRQK